MRGYYLKSGMGIESGCRGGVGHGYDTGFSNEYELEIGHQCNASADLIALCILHDEIIELLAIKDSPLHDMVLSKYHMVKQAIEEEHDET